MKGFEVNVVSFSILILQNYLVMDCIILGQVELGILELKRTNL
jgi:hypothetical protein